MQYKGGLAPSGCKGTSEDHLSSSSPSESSSDAIVLIVGAERSVVSGKFLPENSSISQKSRTAPRESPPSWKKSSVTPTSLSPRISSQICFNFISVSFRGASRALL